MRKYKVKINQKELFVQVDKVSNTAVAFTIDGKAYEVDLQPQLNQNNANSGASSANTNEKEIKAPIPGIIVNCLVKAGDTVEPGQTLVIIEAMKMENNINSSTTGQVLKVHITAGQEVEAGQLLLELS